jgi:hypothetical protein
MADPNPYVVSYNFGGFQSSNPSTPLPAGAVDDELAEIAAATVALVAAVKDIRRSDGALKNGIVTYDSFEHGLQLTIDPTNGLLVAAAVATAQAAAASAAAFDTSAGVHEAAAEAAADAAEASAATVNLSLYLPKAGNFAGIGNVDTALANIQASKHRPARAECGLRRDRLERRRDKRVVRRQRGGERSDDHDRLLACASYRL